MEIRFFGATWRFPTIPFPLPDMFPNKHATRNRRFAIYQEQLHLSVATIADCH